MNTNRTTAAVALAAVACTTGLALGDLLGIEVAHPLVDAGRPSELSYESTSENLLRIDVDPNTLQFEDGGPMCLFEPTGDPPTMYLRIRVEIDEAGMLVGGIEGHDLELVGEVDEDFDGEPDYSGVLLTGEIVGFGYEAGPLVPDIGNNEDLLSNVLRRTARFDLQFVTTGGAFAAMYEDQRIGVTVINERSTFDGDFDRDFSGLARATVGLAGIRGACCFPFAGCAFLTEEECINQGGIYQGDDVICVPDLCPKPGACCLQDGTCVISVLESICEDLGGEFQGSRSLCENVDCDRGACCLPNSSDCVIVTEAQCDTEGGVYQGDDVPCTPGTLGEPGRYRLFNHPDSGNAPPPYGLRLDELFDVTGDCDTFTFDFEAPGAMMFLDYDGTSIRIHGTAFGGLDDGDDYDPDWVSLVEIDFTYAMVESASGDDDLVNFGETDTGTITWLETGETIGLFAKARESDGLAFRFGDEDDDQGHRGFPGNSGWGWFQYEDGRPCGTADWIFAAGDLCVPLELGACCFDDQCVITEEWECVDNGGEYLGNGTNCSGNPCAPPVGACCFGNHCVIKDEWECVDNGGNYLGDGTTCEGEPCRHIPDVVLVVDDADDLTVQEAVRRDLLEGYGFGVTLLTASASDDTYTNALADADVAYVSEEVNSSDVGMRLTDVTIGVVNEEKALLDELRLADDWMTTTTSRVVIVSTANPITAGFGEGPLTILSSEQGVHMVSGRAPGADVLTETASEASLICVARGGMLLGGEAASGRRVHLPWGDNDFDINALNADGRTILRQAIEWAADLDGGGAPETFERRVGSSLDDAEERLSDGWCYVDSSDLELSFSGNEDTEMVGIRFTNVNVPRGAAIDRAYIQFQVDETDSGSTSLTIRAEASDHASPLDGDAYEISSRPRTSSDAGWIPPAWNTVGEAGPDQRTPDLSDVVQEVVDRGGWSSGNAMMFVITGSGTRTAESHDGDASGAPLLHVEYVATADAERHDGERRYDLNADGVTDGSDVTRLLSNWGICSTCPADLDRNGVVDTIDLQMLMKRMP